MFSMRRPAASPPEILLAPSASSGSAALKLPRKDDFPRVDDHVVKPETREEMVRGERIYAQPALAPHADRHFGLDFVLGGHVREGYVGSTDLITHVLHGSDFASDTCIRKDGENPKTGERYLEELAFEVIHSQPVQKATERAEDWSTRGVRRVFGIFVKKGTVEEWVPRKRIWRLLDASSGRVTVDGRDPHDAWPEIAFVFQSPRLVPWRRVLALGFVGVTVGSLMVSVGVMASSGVSSAIISVTPFSDVDGTNCANSRFKVGHLISEDRGSNNLFHGRRVDRRRRTRVRKRMFAGVKGLHCKPCEGEESIPISDSRENTPGQRR